MDASLGQVPLRLACTGFVSEHTGSVAAANALLLRALLDSGHEVDFFSKASFVDPRPSIGEMSGFRFVETTNSGPDNFRRRVEGIPCLGFLADRVDAATYNQLIVRRFAADHQSRHYDLCLWLGDYATGRVPGLTTVSFAQGPPGTDARSIIARFGEIRNLAGMPTALLWLALALVRLSRIRTPPFRHSDHIIVGSHESKRTLERLYGIPGGRISALPYPIDLELFKAESGKHGSERTAATLRVLWLGRIVPRKRLDLFLDGAGLAIRNGLDLRLTIVGSVGFVPGYEQLIRAFPFQERLIWKQNLPREEIPSLMHAHDVLCQPSGEENFGSSVAEAQACNLPVIVGRTNGNADYLCERDIHLADDQPETLAQGLAELAARKASLHWRDSMESRALAEKCFHIGRVADRFVRILRAAKDDGTRANQSE